MVFDFFSTYLMVHYSCTWYLISKPIYCVIFVNYFIYKILLVHHDHHHIIMIIISYALGGKMMKSNQTKQITLAR